MKALISAAVLSVLALSSGCSLLPESEPVQIWQLTPAPTVEKQEPSLTGLRVLRPQSQDLLNGRHILVVPEGEPVSVYADARWSAMIPNLWRDYLLDALQRDSRFARVSSEDVRVQARYELVSRLDAFQTEYRAGQAEVVIRGYLQLVQMDNREVLAERRMDFREPVPGEALSEVVATYSGLMARQSDEIRRWLLEATDKASASQP